jgi:hypothetical protein
MTLDELRAAFHVSRSSLHPNQNASRANLLAVFESFVRGATLFSSSHRPATA